ncbi:family 20 glycosylhydrolase [Puniceicoccales bacterium CK1056]|uniref:Family 20 glycosylhydrolase n=1 Tax=Oceanipulchritudo coccoides TaxID=2706888 RepID=A0A6B2M4G3_9BACT|nr:family 20 glycosylhydrolase [Oceanipulchritudo coccoides]NDV63182.1 family 20 glycosylhydrolase [Oceanipulchritudo coccoides]
MKDLHLLPHPLRLEETGGTVDPNSLEVREVVDPAMAGETGPEAYRIEVSQSGILLVARTLTGLRWAKATLAQLCVHSKIPCLIIEDAPRFEHRGVMLDISRDRVPTMETLKELVDHLSACKMNHLQLYVEHTIAYAGHEDAWRAASPITMDELDELDAYAAGKGIALTANQNCLGHFERWLRHPRYAPLGERSSGSMVRGEHFVQPNTLCPGDPGSLALIEDLLGQLLPHCSGNYANIGCDEPWDLGTGRSKEECEQRGKGVVFSEYVSQVAELCQRLGKRPQYWCDPHPNEGDGLTRDLVALVWEYEDERTFKPRVEAHASVGREVWVAPGTSCWNSSTGRTWNRRGNLDKAASEDIAKGFLCTAWGDGGHRQPWPITLFGFADAAMAAWSGPGHYNDLANGLHTFGNPDLGPWLARLGNVDVEICRGEVPCFDGSPSKGRQFWNSTALWKDMHTQLFDRTGYGDVAAWERVRERLTKLLKLPDGVEGLLADECAFSVDLARWAADRAIIRRDNPTTNQRKELAARMVDIIANHRRLWLARSRYGGLEDSTAHYIQLARNW